MLKKRWTSPRNNIWKSELNSVLNKRSGEEYCRSMCMYAVFIFRTGHGVSDATRLLHQDHRLTSCHRASCVSSLRRRTQKAKSWAYAHPSAIFLSEQDFDVCQSGPGEGTEAWLEDWGLMKRSKNVACCVCLPFCPAAWTVEIGEHSSWPRRDGRHGNAHWRMAWWCTHCSVPRKCPQRAIILDTQFLRCRYLLMLLATCRFYIAEKIWGYI